MRNYLYLFIIIFVDVLFLLYDISNISIGYKEAWIYFFDRSFLHYLIRFSVSAFGENDFALRIPVLLFHVANIVLIYEVGRFFVKKDKDSLFATLLYALLPGVNSGAILVNSVTIVIFFTLLFLFLYLKGFRVLSYLILLTALFIDNSFLILYMALIVYGYFIKDNFMIFFPLILAVFSLLLFGIELSGKPIGYFLDIFGAYALIFSPFLFIYFFYALYRILIREKKDILWFISFIALILSLLFSFRQKVHIEDFAAFVVVGMPVTVRVFFASYRIRLARFRKIHRFFFILIFGFLIFNFLILHFNKVLFLVYENPSKHFANKFYFVKELSKELKRDHINGIVCNDEKLCLRLKFYGIEKGNNYIITQTPLNVSNSKKVSIRYMNKLVKTYYVSKINI